MFDSYGIFQHNLVGLLRGLLELHPEIKSCSVVFKFYIFRYTELYINLAPPPFSVLLHEANAKAARKTMMEAHTLIIFIVCDNSYYFLF